MKSNAHVQPYTLLRDTYAFILIHICRVCCNGIFSDPVPTGQNNSMSRYFTQSMPPQNGLVFFPVADRNPYRTGGGLSCIPGVASITQMHHSGKSVLEFNSAKLEL